MLSSITRTVPRNTINLAVAVVLAFGALTVTADKAQAYGASPNPTISCLGNALEIQGRTLSGQSHEVLYSMFFVYRWDGNRWQHYSSTQWVRVPVKPQSFTFGPVSILSVADGHYTAIERIAAWDGSKWVNNDALTKLKPYYPGNSYYATC